MIQANAIKEKYASMHDSELLKFAEEEGHSLPFESAGFLDDELTKRKLVRHLNNKNDVNSTVDGTENFQEPDMAGRWPVSAWSYVFDQKEAAKSNEDIIAGLVETGMDESDALRLLSCTGIVAKTKFKKAELDKLTGGLIFICGIAVNFLPLQPNSNRLIYIFAYCAILYGAARFIRGMYYKTRFTKVLENIAAENENNL